VQEEMTIKNQLDIYVDDGSIDFLESGSVTGIISFQSGDFFFPEKEWNDFIVVILVWWINSINKLIKQGSGNVDLRFMDGPYLINADFEDTGSVHLKFINDGSNGSKRAIEHELNIDFDRLVKVISTSANTVLRKCHNANISSNDIHELQKSFSNLRSKNKWGQI